MSYPLDAPGGKVGLLNVWNDQPFPPYPYAASSSLSTLFPAWFHDWSLQAAVPITFALVYYTVAHTANHFQSGRDHTKGDASTARLLRFIVVAHNAFLCLYSLFTFLATAPVAVDLFVQGYRAAGRDGLNLALCSIPTDTPLLGRWVYLFYLSKYYEVVDSLILYLKGKRIGNLQSYHHAGALFSMWIAYRFQAQAVWVFVVFNSGVHTLMYAYYFSAALKLPFPRALKRNLTTLQILQIASGTLTVNTYYVHRLDPAKVYAALSSNSIQSSLPVGLFAGASAKTATSFLSRSLSSSPLISKRASLTNASFLHLSTFARQRMGYATPALRSSCIETQGSAIAIAGNTAYMAPLLVLFANFYVASYLKHSDARKEAQKPTLQNGNGNGKHL
jgi:hypothetical protein